MEYELFEEMLVNHLKEFIYEEGLKFNVLPSPESDQNVELGISEEVAKEVELVMRR